MAEMRRKIADGRLAGGDKNDNFFGSEAENKKFLWTV